MSDLDLRFERLSKTSSTIGVRVFVEERLVPAGSVNPYRENTIGQLVIVLIRLQPDAEALAQDIQEKSLECLDSSRENGQVADDSNPLERMPQDVREDGISLLKDPFLLLRVIHDAQQLGIAGEAELVTCFYLTGTSRLLPRTLATVTTGASSAGKSFVLDITGCSR